MFKFSAIILLVSVVYYTQCLPTISQVNTQSQANQNLHLYINNGSDATNYHLTSVISDVENESQLLNAELNAILPYLNFMFDSPTGSDGSEDCLEQLEIQLVQIN